MEECSILHLCCQQRVVEFWNRDSSNSGPRILHDHRILSERVGHSDLSFQWRIFRGLCIRRPIRKHTKDQSDQPFHCREFRRRNRGTFYSFRNDSFYGWVSDRGDYMGDYVWINFRTPGCGHRRSSGDSLLGGRHGVLNASQWSRLYYWSSNRR